jgi:hypothetical protein
MTKLFAKYTCAILLLFFAGTSMAQQEFRGGIYAGPLVSQMSGDGLGGWNKLGLNFGGFVAVPIGNKLSFNAGLGFINKGSQKPADPNNGDNAVFIYRINYIEAPLLLEFQIGDVLRLKAGATAALLIKQKTWDNSTSSEIDITPEFKPIDIGGAFGLEANLSERISAEIRATTSIIPARDAPSVANRNSYYEQGNYHQGLQLLVFFKL